MSNAQILASVDIVALRLNVHQRLEVLLIRRAREPFIDQWALPGVLVNGRCADASLDAAASRALNEKARVQPRHLEQVVTVGSATRDPRGWSMSTLYLALLCPTTCLQGEDLQFFALDDVLQGQVPLPFDHAELVAQAHARLGAKAVYTALPLHLLQARFTVTEALGAFEVCLGQAVQHTTLRGRLERMKEKGWIVDTGDKNRPPMGRPQTLLEHRPEAGRVFVFDRSVLV